MRFINGPNRQQRGDTIVEVMIVLAILGLAIGIAYETANRSLLNARQAQENSQAVAVAQSQVEQLVSIGCASDSPTCASSNQIDDFLSKNSPTSSFCVISGKVKAGSDVACAGLTSLIGGSVEIMCINGCSGSPPPARTFEVTVTWDDVLGHGKDTVKQDYTLPTN